MNAEFAAFNIKRWSANVLYLEVASLSCSFDAAFKAFNIKRVSLRVLNLTVVTPAQPLFLPWTKFKFKLFPFRVIPKITRGLEHAAFCTIHRYWAAISML